MPVTTENNARTLHRFLDSAGEFHARGLWRDWYDSSFYTRLSVAYQEVSDMVLTLLVKSTGKPTGETYAYSQLEGVLYDRTLSKPVYAQRWHSHAVG